MAKEAKEAASGYDVMLVCAAVFVIAFAWAAVFGGLFGPSEGLAACSYLVVMCAVDRALWRFLRPSWRNRSIAGLSLVFVLPSLWGYALLRFKAIGATFFGYHEINADVAAFESMYMLLCPGTSRLLCIGGTALWHKRVPASRSEPISPIFETLLSFGLSLNVVAVACLDAIRRNLTPNRSYGVYLGFGWLAVSSLAALSVAIGRRRKSRLLIVGVGIAAAHCIWFGCGQAADTACAAPKVLLDVMRQLVPRDH